MQSFGISPGLGLLGAGSLLANRNQRHYALEGPLLPAVVEGQRELSLQRGHHGDTGEAPSLTKESWGLLLRFPARPQVTSGSWPPCIYVLHDLQGVGLPYCYLSNIPPAPARLLARLTWGTSLPFLFPEMLASASPLGALASVEPSGWECGLCLGLHPCFAPYEQGDCRQVPEALCRFIFSKIVVMVVPPPSGGP